MRPSSIVATLAVYLGLVAWLTWPLSAHLTTALPNPWFPCRFDTLLVASVLSHESRALVTAPSQLLEGNFFHPTRHAVLYGDAEFGAIPYFIAPFLATGNPAFAVNVTFLGCVALTAWALHLIVVRWTGSHWAGFVAAWCFLTTRWVLWIWFPANPTYSVVHYLPFIMLATATPTRRFTDAVRVLPLVVLQGLVSVYMAVATLAPLALLGTVRLFRARSRAGGVHLLAVVGLAALVLCGSFWGFVLVARENPAISQQTIYGTASYPKESLPWGPFEPGKPMGMAIACWGVLAAGVVCARRRGEQERRRTACAVGAFWAVTGLVFSLTRQVTWRGHVIRMPQYALIHWIPFLDAVRGPARIGIVGLIGLAVLTGVAVAEVLRRAGELSVMQRSAPRVFVARAAITAITVVTIYATYVRGTGKARIELPSAYPLQDARVADSRTLRILATPGGPLLELPVGPTVVAHAQAMYRSIFHRRAILNGYDGYWPARFPARMEAACRLPDRDALAALRRETGLEMILVHAAALDGPAGAPPYGCGAATPNAGDPAASRRDAWFALAEHGRDDLLLVARDGDDLLFSIQDAAERID